MKYEGFWSSENVPIVSSEAVPIEFLTNYNHVVRCANYIQYMGYSNCRICGCRNGDKTYELDGWQFPEGFKHYFQHNVHPSREFYLFVVTFDTSRPSFTEPPWDSQDNIRKFMSGSCSLLYGD